MKLKVYRACLLASLILVFAFNVFLFVNTCIYASSNSNTSDNILFIICMIVLLTFNGLEIFNTCYSFKHGSNFIIMLAYDNKKTVNTKFIVFSYIAGILALLIVCYFSVIVFTTSNLIFDTFSPLLKYLIIGLFTLVFVDNVFIILFPYLAKEDPSFKKK